MLERVKNLLGITRVSKEYLLVDSEFDRKFYLATYPDVAAAGLDPVQHYLDCGHGEGRNPRADFDTAFYLAHNPDVARAGINGFLHYVQYGKLESRPGVRAPISTHQPAVQSQVVDSRQQQLDLSNGESAAFSAPRDEALYDYEDSDALVGLEHRAILADMLPRLKRILPKPKFGFDTARIMRRVDITPEPTLEKSATDYPVAPSDLVDVDLVDHIVSQAKGRTLSLDIWDTVLRRHCFPDETKLRSARAIWLRHRGNERIAPLHPVDILQVRRVCEAAAADEDFEYSLETVGRLMAGVLSLDADAFVPQFLEDELRIEMSAAYADPTLAVVLKRHEGRKIAVSDFYLNGSALAQILAAKGVEVASVYASSEHMQTKRAGGLFDTVLAAEGVAPSEMVHVGDKLDADVHSPRIRAIPAIHYSSENDQVRSVGMEANFWSHVEGDGSGHFAKLMGIVGRSDEDDVPLAAISVLACGFILHIIEEALRREVQTVFFCTREGVFLKKIFDKLVSSDVFDIGSYPTSAILEVSRRATFAASMEDFNVPELMRLWNQYSSQSIAALATSLNIDLQGWHKEATRLGLDPHKVITYPWQDAKFQKFLDNRTVKAHARRSIWAQRRELQKYLEAAGFEPQSVRDRLLVDIGWRGTIQDNLARIVGGTVHGCYLGLERYLNPQPAASTKSAYVMNANEGDDFRIPEVAGLEFLFNSLGGSVLGYQDGKSIRDIVSREERNIRDYTTKFQNKISETAAKVAEYIKQHGLVADDILSLSRAIVKAYSYKPPREVVAAFYDLEHNESFGVGATEVMGDRKEEFSRLSMAQGSDFHGRATELLDEVRWHAAFLNSDEYGDFVTKLTPSQKMNLPILDKAPAILRRGSLGRPKVNILSPRPIKGSGGHRTIYNLSRGLADAGLEVHLMHESSVDRETADWVASILNAAPVVQHDAWLNYLTPTAAISTIWYSPFFSSEFWGEKTKGFYFIQDFEAMFNPVGDTYLRGERSYCEGGNAICIGKWLPHVLRNQYGMGSVSAGLGVDHDVYLPLPKMKGQKKVAFLYQPEKFRRAPELCAQALALLKKKIPEVEILVYGSDHRGNLPFPHKHLGLITDLHAINRLYNECVIGLCVSSTNPSRIPFEMMAAGCVPVDIYRYNNLFDYDEGCGSLAFHSPASLAVAMCELIENEEVCAQRASNGVASVKYRTMDWEVDVAVNAVVWGLEGGDFRDLDVPALSYVEQAVVSEEDDCEAVQRFLAWQRHLATGISVQ